MIQCAANGSIGENTNYFLLVYFSFQGGWGNPVLWRNPPRAHAPNFRPRCELTLNTLYICKFPQEWTFRHILKDHILVSPTPLGDLPPFPLEKLMKNAIFKCVFPTYKCYHRKVIKKCRLPNSQYNVAFTAYCYPMYAKHKNIFYMQLL